MEDQNIQIVQESIEQINNLKRFDRLYEYYSQKCAFYSPPYVGIGFYPDDSSGVKMVIKSVAPNGPAAGKLQVGDVLLRASDVHSVWEGFDQLRSGVWGQGKLGTGINLTVQRDGETLEIPFVRGRIEGFYITLDEILDTWRWFLFEEMPDLHTVIDQILASGDRVAYYLTNTGTSALYQQSAIWTECSILRLENGKIVESRGVEDGLSQWRQFGFHITDPVKEVA